MFIQYYVIYQKLKNVLLLIPMDMIALSTIKVYILHKHIIIYRDFRISTFINI